MNAEEISVYLSLGSNLGNRRDNLERALELIGQRLKITQKSSIYETDPEDYLDQPRFLNLVCHAYTLLEPQALLALVKGIEVKVGRTPSHHSGPRIIDIDILLYGDRRVNEPELEIPHPRLDKRAFVLVPLNQIAPELVHPVSGKSVKQLLGELEKGVQGVFHFAELWDDENDEDGDGEGEGGDADVSVDG
jgi:2-amino-4-hydroxy-6-hydroxymethyldihydropteridine diphosphokinase